MSWFQVMCKAGDLLITAIALLLGYVAIMAAAGGLLALIRRRRFYGR